MTTKNVKVTTTDQPISYINLQGSEVQVGVLSARNYHGENLTRFLVSKNADDMSNASDVGLSRQEVAEFLNFSAAQTPMLDLGFTMKDITVSRGGTDFHSLWTYPVGREISYADPITWDHHIWGTERQKYVGQPLQAGVILSGTLRRGTGFSWQSAIYRLICTNGLARWENGSVLYRASGSNFNAGTLAENLFNLPVAADERQLTGKTIGNRRGVSRAMRIIGDYFTDATTTEERDQFLQDTPPVLVETLAPITRAPQWYNMGILDQLGHFYQNTDRPITEIDIQNVVTNAVNLPRFGPQNAEIEQQGHSVSRALRMTNSLVSSVSNLIGIYSLAA
jgi:hypothetical protein